MKLEKAGDHFKPGRLVRANEIAQWKDIENGDMIAAVDQQPYSQGFYGVTQAALAVKYGLYPSEMNTGGAGLVDKSNYTSAVEWAGIVR